MPLRYYFQFNYDTKEFSTHKHFCSIMNPCLFHISSTLFMNFQDNASYDTRHYKMYKLLRIESFPHFLPCTLHTHLYNSQEFFFNLYSICQEKEISYNKVSLLFSITVRNISSKMNRLFCPLSVIYAFLQFVRIVRGLVRRDTAFPDSDERKGKERGAIGRTARIETSRSKRTKTTVIRLISRLVTAGR